MYIAIINGSENGGIYALVSNHETESELREVFESKGNSVEKIIPFEGDFDEDSLSAITALLPLFGIGAVLDGMVDAAFKLGREYGRERR